jgi:hypothetical protein
MLKVGNCSTAALLLQVARQPELGRIITCSERQLVGVRSDITRPEVVDQTSARSTTNG